MSSISSTGSASISGVISGLDTDTILEKLAAVAQAPITNLKARQDTLSAKLAAWQEVNSLLLSLKEKASALALKSAFSSKTVTSTNTAIATATASTSASAGSYSFSVESVATTHKLASQGFSSQEDLVGSGTVSIALGSGAAMEIDVEGLTLSGLRDAINNADAGVKAYLVNTGSGETPYRLMLTSETMGTDGEMNVTVNLSGGTSPAFTEIQTATDAIISLGDGITVTRSSNIINDIFPGITLTLNSASPGTAVGINAAIDTATIEQTISDFVDQYNAVVDYLTEQWTYDSDTEETGTLFGEYTLYQIQDDLVSAISNPVSGLSSSLSLLSQIGIRLATDGKLTLDSSELEEILLEDPEGVMKLFSRYGQATSASVSFLSATDDTKVSGTSGYAVEITQAAAHARVTSGAAQSEALTEDEILTINGAAITLSAGMTQSQIVALINSKSSELHVTAAATGADGTGTGQYLTLTSVSYGSKAQVTALSNKSNTSGGSGVGNVLVTEDAPTGESGTGTGAAGVDVAGTINGEAATGSGQILTSTTGDAEGLALLITATSAGSYGTITYSAGAGAQLNDILSFLTDTTDGLIKNSEDSLQDQIDDIDDEIVRLQESIDNEQARLRSAFNNMESALATLKSQGDYLTTQLAQIEKNWKGSS